MAGYNRVVMIGNLTRDPEYKQLASGQAVCRLGLASNRQFKNRQTGTMVQEVCYVDIDVWGAQAESCRQYLQKGRSILVEGRLKFDTWENADGQTRNKHSIVADRIVFLSAGASSESVEQTNTNDRLNPKNPQEKELLDQIEQIKQRTQAKAQAKPATVVKQEQSAAPSPKQPAQQQKSAPATGEIAFKDEPPFQDDLPF